MLLIKWVTNNCSLTLVQNFGIDILLPKKFLQFHWPRVEVFQLNLKYLHVNITVTMVTKITKINNLIARVMKKMAERFPDFENQEIQELKENSVNQNTKKSALTWLNVWTSWAENKDSETNLLAYKVKQLSKNKQMALHD